MVGRPTSRGVNKSLWEGFLAKNMPTDSFKSMDPLLCLCPVFFFFGFLYTKVMYGKPVFVSRICTCTHFIG